jgi:hypothetical protein
VNASTARTFAANALAEYDTKRAELRALYDAANSGDNGDFDYREADEAAEALAEYAFGVVEALRAMVEATP